MINECLGCFENNCIFCNKNRFENHKPHKDDLVKYNKMFLWRPFEYLVLDADKKTRKVHGFLPHDVRKHCDFVVMKIEGPIVKGFSSWLVYQIVNND